MRRAGGRRSGGGTPATVARTDASNTFTGEQTFAGGVKVTEGANARMGVATMTLGIVTVANTRVTANSRIFLTGQNTGGGAATWGDIGVSSRSVGVSFTIASSSSTDTRQVAWEIKEPA